MTSEATVTSPNDVMIRAFQPEDASGVSALIAVTMRESNARDYPTDVLEALIAYFTPAKLTTLAHERTCLVALNGALLVGTAALEDHALVTFFVHPRWQARGVGSRLLTRLEQLAREAEIDILEVHASLTGVGFYESRGYQRSVVMTTATAGRQIVLEKKLRAHAG